MTAITVQEMSKEDVNSPKIETCRSIFISYFMDLYKEKDPSTLKINGQIESYLTTIFEKTKMALKDQQLYAFLAYMDDKPVGFSTFGPLENSTTILMRTLPVALNFKKQELNIRKALMSHVGEKFPETQRIVMMVRHANKAHQSFCHQEGFKGFDNIFEQSDYVKRTYDRNCYYGYSYDL